MLQVVYFITTCAENELVVSSDGKGRYHAVVGGNAELLYSKSVPTNRRRTFSIYPAIVTEILSDIPFD